MNELSARATASSMSPGGVPAGANGPAFVEYQHQLAPDQPDR